MVEYVYSTGQLEPREIIFRFIFSTILFAIGVWLMVYGAYQENLLIIVIGLIIGGGGSAYVMSPVWTQ